MVKVTKIGRPACLSPKPAMQGHGEASETERVSVVAIKRLALSRRLKIQSGHYGNMMEQPTPTKCNNHNFHIIEFCFGSFASVSKI